MRCQILVLIVEKRCHWAFMGHCYYYKHQKYGKHLIEERKQPNMVTRLTDLRYFASSENRCPLVVSWS